VTYRAVLFDLDGTLLDTLRDIADAMNAVLARLRLPGHPPVDYRLFVGEGVTRLVERALPEERRDGELIRRAEAMLDEEYAHRWNATTRPYPGIPGLLDELAARGVPLAVLSNKPDDFTLLTVSRLLPAWRFHPVMGARPGVPRKPDPAAALEIAGILGIVPSDILYLGDSGVDMRTARAAGMHPVGALWGFRSAAELNEAGAAALVGSPAELLELL
jgi:phosphoglycolate phosphatase